MSLRILLHALLARFGRNRDGNVVLIFALTMLPILGLVGLAVDFSMELRVKTALDASLDAAVLAASAEAYEIIETQSGPNYDATPIAIAYAEMGGAQVFNTNAARVKTAAAPTLNLVVTRSGLVLTTSGSYTSQSNTMLGNIFGTNYMKAAGQAQSNFTLPKYMNIYIAYDISQSMGIASTTTDMTKMTAAIKTYYTTGGRRPQNSEQLNGCVFGCHTFTTAYEQTGDPSFEVIGHNAGVRLRIDDVKQSILNIINSAIPASGAPATIALGLYSMQHDETPIYNPATLQPSTNYSALTTAANAIDLGNSDNGGTGDSALQLSLQDLNTIVAASGDGSSATSPQTFVFIITDGVSDVAGGCTDGHCTQAFNPAWCSAFKSKNATVGVIYTTYVPFPSEQTYVDLVQPFQAQIAPNLQQCASPGYYYEASDGPAIQAAAQALFNQATSGARLTQ